MRHYLSGGTGGAHRLVSLSQTDLDLQVSETAEALREFGVVPGSVVLVAVPADPWSIGRVFGDAAVRAGADVVAFGNLALHASIAELVVGLRPSHVVAGSSLLSVAGGTLGTLLRYGGARQCLIAVGEALTTAQESALRSQWNCIDVRRVYGTSTLGTIAVQATADADWLRINPRIEMQVHSGVLVARRADRLGPWESTGDVGEVRDTAGMDGWWAGREVRILHRDRESVVLADGTRVDGGLLSRVAAATGAHRAECWTFEDSPIVVWFVLVGGTFEEETELLDKLRNAVLELADPAALFILRCRVVSKSNALLTARQKAPLVRRFRQMADADAALQGL